MCKLTGGTDLSMFERCILCLPRQHFKDAKGSFAPWEQEWLTLPVLLLLASRKCRRGCSRRMTSKMLPAFSGQL